MEDLRNIILIIFSSIALIISLFILWKEHLKPFKLKITNSYPCLRFYKITPEMSGTKSGKTWWIPSIDIGISFYNLGKRNGEILDIRIVAKNGLSKFIFEPKWIVEFSKFSQNSFERFVWIKDAIIRIWYPVLLRGNSDAHFHIILEAIRWEEMILDDMSFSFQIRTSKNQKWETFEKNYCHLFESLFTEKESIFLSKKQNETNFIIESDL